MHVIATKPGHDGKVTRVTGEVFEMPDDAKGSWFEPTQQAETATEVEHDAVSDTEKEFVQPSEDDVTGERDDPAAKTNVGKSSKGNPSTPGKAKK